MMDPAAAGYAALAVTAMVALVTMFIFWGAVEQTRLKKLACICSHPIRRHNFRAGKCFDCRCQVYIDAPGAKYDG